MRSAPHASPVVVRLGLRRERARQYALVHHAGQLAHPVRDHPLWRAPDRWEQREETSEGVVVGMFSHVGGAQHLRKVALVLVTGCLVSFTAGQVAGHYALTAPPLASLAARADAPDAAAIAGAISKARRPTVQQPGTHKPTSKPKASKKASHAHTKHKPKPKHHEDRGDKGHSSGKGKVDMLSPGEQAVDQPAPQAMSQAISIDGPAGEGNTPASSGPVRLPPESTANR